MQNGLYLSFMRRIIKMIFSIAAGILGLVLLYAIAAVVLPFITVPAEKTSEPKTTDIYILTNGMHTDLVVPVKSPQYDWSTLIPFQDTRSGRTDFKYLSVGWGDKGFYLDTPTWSQLKFSTAFKASFWLSESAMHCTFYDKMTEGKDCVKISITTAQYKRLIRFIQDKFDYDQNGKVMLIKTNAVYGDNDAFYDAKGRYNFLDTCNTWANDGLKTAGQKAALWTAADFGIFQHYK